MQCFSTQKSSNSPTTLFAQELKAIQAKLDEITETMRNYSFQDNRVLTIAVEHRETCSSVLESHTFGRDQEKEWIVSHLLKHSVDDDAQQISVIPIVGIGGMGKATLAQLVFNDSSVIQRFEMRLWVYVSKKFVLKSVIVLLHSEFEDLPDSIGSLKLIPDSTCKLVNLQDEIFTSKKCSRMEFTPSAEIHSMSKLELVARGYREGLCGLKSLRFLIIFGVPKMLDFPEGIEFSVAGSLQYLRISECKGLRSLPEGLIYCTCLLKLQV